MGVLIDTSVLVAADRGRLALTSLLDEAESYAISVVTAAELLHGAYRADVTHASRRTAFVEGLLDTLPTVGVDLHVARVFARLSAELAAAGRPIDTHDLWIGATAVAHDLSVLALDGDFDRIPGVHRAPVTDIPHPR